MSGSVAAAGACPAQADRTPKSAVATSRTVKIELCFMSRLLRQVGGTAGFRIDLPRGRHLVRCGHSWWQRLADRQPHGGDLLLLCNDGLLGEPPDLQVAAVEEQSNWHVERALIVSDRH